MLGSSPRYSTRKTRPPGLSARTLPPSSLADGRTRGRRRPSAQRRGCPAAASGSVTEPRTGSTFVTPSRSPRASRKLSISGWMSTATTRPSRHQGSQAKGEVAAAGADVGHHVVRLEIETRDEQVGPLLALALRPLQPVDPPVAHHERDLAAHVDLADAVAARRTAGVEVPRVVWGTAQPPAKRRRHRAERRARRPLPRPGTRSSYLPVRRNHALWWLGRHRPRIGRMLRAPFSRNPEAFWVLRRPAASPRTRPTAVAPGARSRDRPCGSARRGTRR